MVDWKFVSISKPSLRKSHGLTDIFVEHPKVTRDLQLNGSYNISLSSVCIILDPVFTYW